MIIIVDYGEGNGYYYCNSLLYCTLCSPFDNLDYSNLDLGIQMRIVRVDLADSIGKESILCLDTTTNR